MSMSYVVSHVRQTLQHYGEIDSSRLNGESSDPDVQAILQSLAEGHRLGGQDGVQKAWKLIANHYPAFAAQVEAPSRLLSSDELSLIPPPVYLYPNDPLHIPIVSKSVHVLYGPPGVGKSFLALAWSAHIAQNYPVVYIMAEGSSGYMKRLKGWQTENNKRTDNLYWWNGAFVPTDANAREQFIETIHDKGIRPALMVFDTFTRTFAGDENQADAIRSYFDALDVLKNEFGCAILIVHHSLKTSANYRGSSAIEGDTDYMMRVSDVDGFIEVSSMKSKDGQRFNPWYFVLKPTQVGQDTTLVVHLVIDTETWRGITPRQMEILRVLSWGIYKDGATKSDLKEVAEFSARDLAITLSRMIKAGLIDSSKGHYYPTSKGWGILRNPVVTERPFVEPPIPVQNVEF